MANAIMSKVWNLLGMEQEENDYEDENDIYENDYEDEEYDNGVEEKRGFIKRNKVVSMPQQSVRMVISQPTSFEQSEEICGFLKEKKSVILSMLQRNNAPNKTDMLTIIEIGIFTLLESFIAGKINEKMEAESIIPLEKPKKI